MIRIIFTTQEIHFFATEKLGNKSQLAERATNFGTVKLSDMISAYLKAMDRVEWSSSREYKVPYAAISKGFEAMFDEFVKSIENDLSLITAKNFNGFVLTKTIMQ